MIELEIPSVMSSPHFDISILSRSKGHSSVAAAAYRSGQKLYDARLKKYHDYSHRKDVVHAEILAPDHVPDFLKNREVLWNEIEKAENRKDAQLARSIILGLPHELGHEERVALLQDYVKKVFVNQGMIADITIHKPDLEKGADRRNHHAHVLLTLRQADSYGLYRTKTRAWNNKDLPNKWRSAWAETQNRAFQKRGLILRVNHRNLKPVTPLYRSDNLLQETQHHLGRKGRPDYFEKLHQNFLIIERNHRRALDLRQKLLRHLSKLNQDQNKLIRDMVVIEEEKDWRWQRRQNELKRLKRLHVLRRKMQIVIKKQNSLFQLIALIFGIETATRHRKHLLSERLKILKEIKSQSLQLNQHLRQDREFKSLKTNEGREEVQNDRFSCSRTRRRK